MLSLVALIGCLDTPEDSGPQPESTWACPSFFPIDQGAALTYGQFDRVDWQMTYLGEGDHQGLDVWQVRTHTSVTGSSTHTSIKTRSYTCHEEGVFLVHVAWSELDTSFSSTPVESEQELPEGYLALPADLSQGVQWTTDGLSFDDSYNKYSETGLHSETWTAQGSSTDLVMGEEQESWRAISDHENGRMHAFVDGIGLVRVESGDEIMSFSPE